MIIRLLLGFIYWHLRTKFILFQGFHNTVFAQFDTQIKGFHLDNETEFSKGFLPSFLPFFAMKALFNKLVCLYASNKME